MTQTGAILKMKYPLQDIMDKAYKYCHGDQDMAHEIVLRKIPNMFGHKPQKSTSLWLSRILGCNKQHILDAQKEKNPKIARQYACQYETNAYCNDPIAEVEARVDFKRSLKDTSSNELIMQYLQAGYTQTQIARKLNVSPAYICMTVSKIRTKFQERTNVPSPTNPVQKR